jgi:hypothetical protein
MARSLGLANVRLQGFLDATEIWRTLHALVLLVQLRLVRDEDVRASVLLVGREHLLLVIRPLGSCRASSNAARLGLDPQSLGPLDRQRLEVIEKRFGPKQR